MNGIFNCETHFRNIFMIFLQFYSDDLSGFIVFNL